MARPRADVGDSESAKRIRETLHQAALYWFSGIGRTHHDVLIRACWYTGEDRVRTLKRRIRVYLANPPLDDPAILSTVIDGYFRRGGTVAATSRGRAIIGTPLQPASLLKQLKESIDRRNRAAERCAKVVAAMPELEDIFRVISEIDDATAAAAAAGFVPESGVD